MVRSVLSQLYLQIAAFVTGNFAASQRSRVQFAEKKLGEMDGEP